MENTYKPLQDYVTKTGGAFSFDNLKTLASNNGISNYTGTDEQNRMLTSTLNSPVVNAPTSTNPNPQVTPSVTPQTNNYSFIASSDPSRNAESDLTSYIKNLLSNPTTSTSATDASKNVIDSYDAYNQKLEAQRQAQIDSINRAADISKTQTENAQVNEAGATNAGLIRAGGYLGNSSSAQGVMNNLGERHRLELAALDAKRNDAIQAAQTAIDDKQFQLAQAKANEIKGLEKEINDRKNTFFNQVLNLTQEVRNQDTATRTKIDDQLKAYSLVDPSTIPQGALDHIDNFYKTPGFAKAYLAASSAAAKAKTQKDQLDATKSYVDLLSSIPAGMSINLPDGSKATGIGKAGDYEVFNKEDANGKVTVVKFNKLTGDLSEYSAGSIGTPSASNSGIDVVKVLGPVTAEFGKLPKDENGFIKPITQDALDKNGNSVTNTLKTPTAIYNTYRQTFIQSNPNLKDAGKIFDDNYLKYLPVSERGNISKESL